MSKLGFWKFRHQYSGENVWWECSECKAQFVARPFSNALPCVCPGCGATMETRPEEWHKQTKPHTWDILALKEYLPIGDNDFVIISKCPRCGELAFSITNTYDYCPHCGAKMEEDEYRRRVNDKAE